MHARVLLSPRRYGRIAGCGFGFVDGTRTESELQPHARHAFDVLQKTPATHVRLNIYPDGGVARLRLYGARATEVRG